MKSFWVHFWPTGEEQDSLIVISSVWKLVLWLIANHKRVSAVVISSE